LKLLNQTTDANFVNGIPRGMTVDVVNYFKSQGIRVDISIGGITYTDEWNTALTTNATLLGQRAAAVATQFDVGIEIDYEQNADPLIPQLEQFVAAYRSVHPYDASGNDHPARLTIDVAAGDRWLIALNRHATQYWLKTSDTGVPPVLDYANAMVSGGPSDWQEHIDGKPNYNLDGYESSYDYVYMHLQERSPFRAGDRVKTGQMIGRVGDSGNAQGCHLHYEMWSAPGWYDGGNPLDPYRFLKTWDSWS
jgi:hypothetical protein